MVGMGTKHFRYDSNVNVSLLWTHIYLRQSPGHRLAKVVLVLVPRAQLKINFRHFEICRNGRWARLLKTFTNVQCEFFT